MIWIAPSEKDADNAALEKRLWDAADQFRANSGLKSQEFFLGEFAMSEGQGGGEFYIPSSIVRLLTEVIEPSHGRILDPACGAGGMFVSSAHFVSEYKRQAAADQFQGERRPMDYSANPTRELSIHGVEKTDATGRLCRLNLAVHGLEGEIKRGRNTNNYNANLHDATNRFDLVLANPAFNDSDWFRKDDDVRWQSRGIKATTQCTWR